MPTTITSTGWLAEMRKKCLKRESVKRRVRRTPEETLNEDKRQSSTGASMKPTESVFPLFSLSINQLHNEV